MLGSSIRRRVSVFACAIAATALGVEFSLFGQSARAVDVNLLSCVGTGTTTYSPGLTDTPRQTTFTTVSSLSPCLSLGDPTINSGTFQAKGQGLYSCTVVGTNQPYSVTYNWNKGTSTVTYDTIANVKGEAQTVFTATGIVSSGKYAGARATLEVITANLSPTDCMTPEGITSNTGAIKLIFTGPLSQPDL